MRGKTALSVIFAGIALSAALIIQHSTQAERFQNPMRTFREIMSIKQSLPLEASWAHISLELAVSDDALLKARAIYRQAWIKRGALMKKMEKTSDDKDTVAAIKADAEKLRADLTAKLKNVLSQEQMEELAKWENSLLDRN